MNHATPIASSTPTSQLHKSRPLPTFATESKKLFQFKRIKSFQDRIAHPRSPIKSAPPVSRVFPHRLRNGEKPHAVSFRALSDQTADSTLYSKFYDSKSSELYFEQCFVIEKKLGEGSFGEVMQVKSRDNNVKYAVKRSREKFKGEADRRRKLDEVRKHETLPDHPNCVKFIKAWEEKQRLYIQTELCSMSLQSYLEMVPQLPLEVVWKYLLDLLRGLHHIHSHKFVHFDVKPANIFLSLNGSCKIGDFGLVVDCANDELNNAREGDNKYMAPELLEGVFTQKADVYSLGITILELSSSLDLPSSGMSWQLLRSGFIPFECASMIPFQLLAIIRWMMAPDYNQRPTIHDVLCHPTIELYLQRLKNKTKFSNSLFGKFVQSVSSAVEGVFTSLSLSVPGAESTPKKCEIPENSLKSNDVDYWKDSSSSSNDVLSHNLSNSFENCDQDPVFSPVRNTPIPFHGSSPIQKSSPLGQQSTSYSKYSSELSPLSRRKPESNAKDGTRTFHDLDYFVSDDCESEDDAAVSRLFTTQPRNLLHMLNEVSSDNDSLDGEHNASSGSCIAMALKDDD